MFLDVSLEDEGQALDALEKLITDIEDGRGADGVGHGRLKPPAEELLDQGEEAVR